MEVAKITSKGQITIPISIRRKLELNEGDKVLFIYKPEGVMMVNPVSMSSGYGEAEEADDIAYAIAAMKEKKAPKATPKTAVSKPDDDVMPETAAAEAAPQVEAAPRPVPPPVEEPDKPEKQIGGLNLGTLLDDIRSIGSNI